MHHSAANLGCYQDLYGRDHDAIGRGGRFALRRRSGTTFSLSQGAVYTHTHTLTITCTCYHDVNSGIQDLEIYSHADSLSLSSS